MQLGETLEFRLRGCVAPLADEEKYRPQVMVMIASGAGIVPVLHQLREMLRECLLYRRLIILWAVERAADLMYQDYLDGVASTYGSISVHYVVQDGCPVDVHYKQGKLNEPILQTIVLPEAPPSDNTRIVLSGPRTFCREVKELLSTLGYVDDAIYVYG